METALVGIADVGEAGDESIPSCHPGYGIRGDTQRLLMGRVKFQAAQVINCRQEDGTEYPDSSFSHYQLCSW